MSNIKEDLLTKNEVSFLISELSNMISIIPNFENDEEMRIFIQKSFVKKNKKEIKKLFNFSKNYLRNIGE